MLTIVACGLAVVLALLIVPVRVAFIADPRGTPRFRLHVTWLFGLVGVPVRAPDGTSAQDEEGSKPASGDSLLRARRAMAFLRTSGVVARTKKFLGDLVGSLHPEIETMRIELGLEDPADTGQAWAVLGPLSGWLAYRYDGRVRLDPNFETTTVEVEGRAQLTIIPLQTVALAVAVLASPTILRGLYSAHQTGSK